MALLPFQKIQKSFQCNHKSSLNLLRLKQGRLKKSLEDVEKVIDSNPHHSRSLAIKADVLFQQCNFEHALMFFERGLKVSENTN